MKSLLVLLLAGLGLGGIYWATQKPDASAEDMQAHVSSVGSRLKHGLDAVIDNGAESASRRQQLDNMQQALDEQQAALDARLALVEQSVDSITRGDALANPGESYEQQLQASALRTDMETRLQALDERLDQLASQDAPAAGAPAQNDEIAAINERLLTLMRKIDEGSQTSQGPTADQTELSELASRLADQTQQLQDQQQIIQERLAQLTSADTELLDRLTFIGTTASSGIAGSDDSNAPQLGAANPGFASAIDQRFAAIESRLSGNPASADNDLAQQLEAAQARISKLENQDGNLQQIVDELQSSIKGIDPENQGEVLTTRLAEIESRLESGSNTGELESGLAEVRGQVAEFQNRDFVTRQDLLAQQQGKSVEYKIYFDADSKSISDEASRVLDSMIAQEKNRTTGVSIYGFTDRSGDAAYNQRLAVSRASAVRSYLIQNGLDFALMNQVSGLGEDAAAASYADDTKDPGQRVVVIYARQP